MTSSIIGILLMISGCTNRDTIVDKSKLLGSDYRLFQNTPAWELAKSVEDGDTAAIRLNSGKNKELIDYRDAVYGQTLLSIAVYRQNYNSVRTLLELGADPNKQDTYNGTSPLMVAAGLGGGGFVHPYADPRYLEILLKYGGDPNAVQDGKDRKRGNRTSFTPLLIACESGVFDYVKILVDAGADINAANKHGFSALYAATISGNPDIVMYLLEKGADFKQPMYTNVKGEKKYILDALEVWGFEKNSGEYKKEIQIEDWLKSHGTVH